MKNLLFVLIRFYQRYITVLYPKACRYYPTCSQYMIEAVESYGVIRGVILGVKRILKCHPFSDGGIDMVSKQS
jgi:uncharacterized protein